MVSLVKKRSRETSTTTPERSKRVNGKPKIVWQKYLGRAEDIVDAVEGPQPQHAVVRDFAALAALLDVARELDIVECVDRYAPKRGSGPSVGTYILIAIPQSLRRAVLQGRNRRLVQANRSRPPARHQSNQLSSQRFWDNFQGGDGGIPNPGCGKKLFRLGADDVCKVAELFQQHLRHRLYVTARMRKKKKHLEHFIIRQRFTPRFQEAFTKAFAVTKVVRFFIHVHKRVRSIMRCKAGRRGRPVTG